MLRASLVRVGVLLASLVGVLRAVDVLRASLVGVLRASLVGVLRASLLRSVCCGLHSALVGPGCARRGGGLR